MDEDICLTISNYVYKIEMDYGGRVSHKTQKTSQTSDFKIGPSVDKDKITNIE